MQRRRAVHAAGLGVLGALALAGCSSTPDSAGDAWQQARTQLDEAESVHLTTAYTSGDQGPATVAWDYAGRLHEDDVTSVASLEVAQDSHLTVETRTVDGTSYVHVTTEGPDVPDEVKEQYADEGWRKAEADEVPANGLRDEIESIGLPAADALKDADVEPEEVHWAGGDALRYTVPTDVSEAAMGDGDAVRVLAFTVDEDGSLVGLRVGSDTAEQEYTLTDWNDVDPAEVPEEVAE